MLQYTMKDISLQRYQTVKNHSCKLKNISRKNIFDKQYAVKYF